MATVMCGSQLRTTPVRARMAGREPVRRAEPVRICETLVIVSADTSPAELIDQRLFTKRDATSERVVSVHAGDNVGFGFSTRARKSEIARASLRGREGTVARSAEIKYETTSRGNSNAAANL
jgi:hypothetical protein